MTSDITRTIPRYVAGAALALAVLALVFGGVEVGLGAVAGAMVAVLDAMAITWLTTRIIGGADAGFVRPGFAAVLLGAKLFLLLAVCWALLSRWGVEPVGFCVGLGGLVLGMLLGGIDSAFKQSRIAEER